MNRTLILLLASAALSVPAVAQQSPQGTSNEPQGAMQRQDAMQGPSQPSYMPSQSVVNLNTSEVRQLQQELRKQGFKAGPADGILGPRTEAALRQFQQQKGLHVTGQPDQQTLAALGASAGTPSGQTAADQQPPTGQGGTGSRTYGRAAPAPNPAQEQPPANQMPQSQQPSSR